MDIAVAMIVFNRPDITRRVIAEVAKAQPARLYVISDGPRAGRSGEAESVAAIRAMFETIDWPCTVHRNFSPMNLGCCRRVTSGIDWVFENEECAIILEDDCLPAPAFFSYCQEMLDLYRAEPRVFAISGSNFARRSEPPAHYLSNYALMWGWATWRDRWSRYVVDPHDANAVISTVWRAPFKRYYWRRIFERLATGAVDTWDYQWILTVWRHRALCCRPSVNLIENIGFGADATHTVAVGPLTDLPTYRGTDSFRTRLGPVAADAARDAVDDRAWLQLNPKTLVSMMFPSIPRLAKRFRSAKP